MVLQRPSSVSMPATCAAAVVVSASIRLTPAASTEPWWLRRCCMPRCAPTSADEHAVSTLTCHKKFLSGALIHFLAADNHRARLSSVAEKACARADDILTRWVTL